MIYPNIEIVKLSECKHNQLVRTIKFNRESHLAITTVDNEGRKYLIELTNDFNLSPYFNGDVLLYKHAFIWNTDTAVESYNTASIDSHYRVGCISIREGGIFLNLPHIEGYKYYKFNLEKGILHPSENEFNDNLRIQKWQLCLNADEQINFRSDNAIFNFDYEE